MTEVLDYGLAQFPAIGRGPAGGPGNDGILSFVTTDISGALNVNNATHKGKLLNLTGDLYTVTFPSAAGFDAAWSCGVVNASSTRAKFLSINGVIQRLWPGQMALVTKSATATWSVIKASRWKTPGTQPLNLYTNFTTGDDTANDGLDITSPLKTCQTALETVLSEWDLRGQSPVTRAQVNMAAGVNDSQGIHISPHDFVGAHGGQAIRIQGGAGAGFSPNTGLVSCVETFYGLVLQLFDLNLTSGGGGGINAQWGSKLYLSGCNFGACLNNAHITVNHSGTNVELLGDCTVSSNALIMINAANGGSFRAQGFDFDFTANASFAGGVMIGSDRGGIRFSGSSEIRTNGFTVNGKKGAASVNGVIWSATGVPDTFFPGNSNGTAATGGQYI